jgi:hypothetical protein
MLDGGVCHVASAQAAPDPVFEKPLPATLAEWAKTPLRGVRAAEVSDYAPALFKGALEPSPPHADHNPRKAVIVGWEKATHRLVFSHEASYVPWLELPNGAGLCNQFFEANNGWGELFNAPGRRERNSFVDIIESGPDRAWVRWNYFCVQANDDSRPALRGTEDYIAYPNGLVWRRLTYTTMMPDKPEGYSWQPLDFFAVAPHGTQWKDLFTRDAEHGDYCVAVVLDAYSDRQYRVFWDDHGKPRREGDKDLLAGISKSKGFAMVMPFQQGCEFLVLGEASGFPTTKSQIVDHSFNDTGGWGWKSVRWDHWPVGWLNSQSHEITTDSPYPYHFGPLSHYIVDPPLVDGPRDYPLRAADMELNRWSARHVYYTLTGVAKDLTAIRRLAKQWLDKGPACARPESIADLLGLLGRE